MRMPDRLADDTLASSLMPRLFEVVLQQGLAWKGTIDRVLELTLGFVGLPSRADLIRLQAKLDVLQGTVTNLSIKVDRLLDAEASRRDAAESERVARAERAVR